MKAFAFVLVFGAIACTPAMQSPGEQPAPEEQPRRGSIDGSRALIREMHDRYAGKWYRTLRFEQTNTFYTQSGKEEKSQWVENLSVPGRLRIDFQPLSARSGMLILNNRVTTFDNGRRVQTRRSIQPLLTLTADVYAIPASVTIRRIDSLGIDLSKFHETRWQKERTYVIGAESGDLESTQIWVDADRLLLMRFIQRERRVWTRRPLSNVVTRLFRISIPLLADNGRKSMRSLPGTERFSTHCDFSSLPDWV